MGVSDNLPSPKPQMGSGIFAPVHLLASEIRRPAHPLCRFACFTSSWPSFPHDHHSNNLVPFHRTTEKCSVFLENVSALRPSLALRPPFLC